MNAHYEEKIKQRIAAAFERSGPPLDFPKLPEIATGRYTSDAFWQAEQQHLWPRSWLFAAHADELPAPGSCKLWRDSGVPIVIINEGADQYRAFYNTCQHRGGPLVVEEYSRQSRLQCGYHGWTYNYAGELIGVPDQRDFVDLDKACYRLKELRCESWGKWIFVNRDAQAKPLQDFIAPIAPELEQFDLANLRLYDKHSIPIAANWKACTDSFMETYHLQHIHPHTVNQLLDHKGTVIALLEQGHNKMYTPNREGLLTTPDEFVDITSVGELPRISNLAYSVFPNMVMPLDAAGFPLLLFWPIDKANTRMDVLWFGADDGKSKVTDNVWQRQQEFLSPAWLEKLAIFDVVLQEDVQFLASQQQSMETGAITGMPLSYLEQRIYHRHEALDEIIGLHNIPPSLAVAPLLQPFIEN
ncbi:SRPBCC family protein [Oceanicoccus sp. KOV_DT_Chl]|uniref:aromatic ring-hydroxylating oxygenase subunit alpha n=1 Tax=Oceanicoccus sp. KOV_DT_Chl TaxID=1904639 RepID=UPI000C7C0C1B|nr:aromatic ring-hydroxylating dioxygenase subunit alpha [Oceanicoccus sp. KOV_DT_Chl]